MLVLVWTCKVSTQRHGPLDADLASTTASFLLSAIALLGLAGLGRRAAEPFWFEEQRPGQWPGVFRFTGWNEV